MTRCDGENKSSFFAEMCSRMRLPWNARNPTSQRLIACSRLPHICGAGAQQQSAKQSRFFICCCHFPMKTISPRDGEERDGVTSCSLHKVRERENAHKLPSNLNGHIAYAARGRRRNHDAG